MKALVIGCGRVGSSIALQLDREGWDVTAVDEKEEALSRLGDHWNGGFVLGHGMDIEVLRQAGIEDADAVVVATDGDNTNIVIGQVAQQRFDNQCVVVRVLDPARAEFYRRRGLRTICPTSVAIARPPEVVAALTGDDEDNLIISQLAREKYGVPKVIARVNDPRNQAHFDLLGISPTVSATRGLMALIEHEVPEHDLVHLLELRKENLEIVEVMIDKGAPAAGKRVEKLDLPEGSRLISITRNGHSEIAVGATELLPGDQVLAILQPGKEDELRKVLLKT